MHENFVADANARFSPPWLWAWFDLHAPKTLLKKIFDLFIARLLSWVLDSTLARKQQ